MADYVRNETSINPECVLAQVDALKNGAGNGSLEATNKACGNASTLLIPERARQRGERAHT